MLKLVHPAVMLGFFYLLFLQRELGRRILQIKDKSPDFKSRQTLVDQHRGMGYAALALVVAGLLGGLYVTSAVLGATSPFMQTYGHGFFGSLILACMVMALCLGVSLKNVVKPKIRERFLTFHTNMVYIIAVFGCLSLLTGVIVLAWGLGTTD